MSAVFGSVPFIIVANTAIEIVVYATGDTIAQRLEHASKIRRQSRQSETGGKAVARVAKKFKHDFDRTLRGGVLSAACGGGAVGWYWWVMLDNLIPGSSLGTLAVKSLINNALYGTLANELFLYCYTASRTGSHAAGCARAKADFAEQSLLNFLLYFPTDIICFSVTGWPRTFIYHGSVLVFDTYFSLLANKKDSLEMETDTHLSFWTQEMPGLSCTGLADLCDTRPIFPPISTSPSNEDDGEGDVDIVTETTVTTSTIVNTTEAVVDTIDATINTTTTTINQVTTIRTTTRTSNRFRSGTAASAEKGKAGRWYDRFLDLYHNRYHQQYQQCHPATGKAVS